MESDELTPAEFDGVRKNRYRPGLPWKRIGFLLLAVVLVVGGYFWRQKVRADALRERMYTQHASEVAPTLELLDGTRTDLVEKTMSAKAGAAHRKVDAPVPVSALHEQKVAYLRVRATDLGSEESLQVAIDAEDADAIGACLGLTLIPVASLADVPEVLTSKWLAGAEDTNDMMRLSVREEQLTRAIERELPDIAARVPADYFLLLVVQGQDRLRDPVDVFLWDLPEDRLVLRSRTENHGKLITVLSKIGPKTDSARAKGDPIVAADCSIAAHIKGQLGEPTMDLAKSD
ncbi:MAG: hypothetical protein AAF436_09395 [Myxococcota bacterium]